MMTEVHGRTHSSSPEETLSTFTDHLKIMLDLLLYSLFFLYYLLCTVQTCS